MADVSKIKLPNGTTYDIKDDNALPLTGGSVTGPVSFGDSVSIDEATVGDLVVNGSSNFIQGVKSNQIVPFMSKTYTGVIASANTQDDGALYFIKVQPTNYYVTWSIKYRVSATIAGISEANGSGFEQSEMLLVGMRNTYAGYDVWNDISNASYRPYYYHCFYRAKQAGIDGGYGHAIGIHLRYSYNPTTTANARTVTFEILEANNCTVTLLDAPVKYASWPGTGSTNYETYNNLDATTNGRTMTGDRNTYVGYGYYRYYYHPTAGTHGIKQYSLYMRDGDGTFQSFTTDHGNGTTKTKNTVGFDLSGGVFYHWSSGNLAANAKAGTGTSTPIYHSIDLRYSTNCGATLTNDEEVYIVGTINNSDGLFYLADTWWTQDLPTSEDGKVYIPIGFVYASGYSAEFNGYLKPLWYKNGRIRPYAPYLTSHQDISGKADKATTLAGYGITDAKIASGTITLGSNTITPLTSSSTLSAAKLSGAIPSAVTATTQASTDNSTKIATTAYVTTAIANLPEPMVFKGSVGTGGTITSLPTAAASNEGHTYKVITALSSPSAKVGDTVISNGSSWVVIPSGDEPSGTVTSVGVSNGGGLSVSGSPITSSGTITISHADTSSQASSSNSGRTYIQSLTLDTYGHVTGISTATETVTNTDTKLQVAEVTSGTSYYPIVGTGTAAATRQYDTTGFLYSSSAGTTSAIGSSTIVLGNNTKSGVANNKQGVLYLYGTTTYGVSIVAGALTAVRTLTLPDANGTVALTSQIPTIPTATQSATTGITASTTATKTTLGTAFTIPNVTSAGSASTWAFEEVSIPNVTAAGSASTWAFEDIACDDITSWSAGSGSASISGAVDSSDSTQLNITISHTHTAPSLSYTARTVSSKKSGANGSAPTLGTAIKVQSKKSGANGSAPTLGTAFTVPNVTGNTSATVSVTDPGHTHSI